MIVKKQVLLPLLWLLAGGVQGAAILEQAKAAYEGEEFPKAFRLFKQAAEKGDAEAQVQLGVCYDDGIGTDENDALALRWYQKAADQGYYLGQFHVGETYSCGCDGGMDIEKADKYLRMSLPGCRQAAKDGDKEAQYALGKIYAYGWAGVGQDLQEAASWYEKAEKHGLHEASYRLGNYYDERGLKKLAERSYEKAFKYYERRAPLDDVGAQITVAFMYDRAQGTKRDEVKSVEWFGTAALRGGHLALYELGQRYLSGGKVVKNSISAWYEMAVKSGKLSRSERGSKVRINWGGNKGIALLTRAALDGDESAKSELGVQYDKGHDVVADPVQAKKWILAAAEQGNILSEMKVAQYYASGKYFPEDSTAAESWRKKLMADALYSRARHWDAAEALIWLFQGNYFSGEDQAKIFKAIQSSADTGNFKAKNELRRLGWFWGLQDLQAQGLFLFWVMAPILAAWLYGRRQSKEMLGRKPSDPVATYYSMLMVTSLLSIFYFIVFIFGSRAFGSRVFRPLKDLMIYPALWFPAKAFQLVSNLGFLVLLVIALTAGWIAIYAPKYRLEKALRKTTWTFGGALRWQFRDFVARFGLLLFIYFPLVLAAIFFQRKTHYAWLLFLPAFGALAFQPLFFRWLWGMRKLGKASWDALGKRLGAKSGVDYQGVYLWDTEQPKVANAMVMGRFAFNQQVIVTSHLQKNVNAKEWEAILAHELGHLKRGHLWILALSVAFYIGAFILWTPHWLLWLGLALWLPLLHRALERDADHFSLRMTGSKPALIAALKKTAKLNFSPQKFNWLHGIFASHPSLHQRLESIGRYCLACRENNRKGAVRCGNCGKALNRRAARP
jgi:TPR repeat protein/Zn-dependent protease with chaperone function